VNALRFAAGVGAGVAFAALVAGAAGVGPSAAEPEAAPAQPRQETKAAPAEAKTKPAARPPAAKKEAVSRGVLARAAASRRGATPEAGAPPQTPARAGSDSGEPVIESVEVDWGATPARP
jgi:hypothetical protein